MKPVLGFFLLTISAVAQTVTPVPSTVPAVASIQLPMYVAAGGAFNQLAGANLWASAIAPVSNTMGIYESTTADLFPVRMTVGGKNPYIFQTSIREGFHKEVFDDGKNVGLIGADAGYSFAQASAAGSATSGVSAAVTITYVRQLNPRWAVMIPIRALYMPSLGGWNPIVEFGISYKPGK